MWVKLRFRCDLINIMIHFSDILSSRHKPYPWSAQQSLRMITNCHSNFCFLTYSMEIQSALSCCCPSAEPPSYTCPLLKNPQGLCSDQQNEDPISLRPWQASTLHQQYPLSVHLCLSHLINRLILCRSDRVLCDFSWGDSCHTSICSPDVVRALTTNQRNFSIQVS